MSQGERMIMQEEISSFDDNNRSGDLMMKGGMLAFKARGAGRTNQYVSVQSKRCREDQPRC
jgi:hypothetical protein